MKTYLIICKRNKCESSEGFRNEDIYHFPILGKELLEFLFCHVLSAAPDKHFPAAQRFVGTLLEKVEDRERIRTVLQNSYVLIKATFHLASKDHKV